jgi:enoyl-CoA hydratase/carnithine racemase
MSRVATSDGSARDGYETLNVSAEGAALFVEIAAPPMNLLGPELVRDLVSLIKRAEADGGVKVLVFKSADPDYFISHVDLNKVSEYRAEAAKLTGEASIALLFRYLSASPLVSIAQVEGRVRGAGSEFVLACDMRFAARESAVFGQFEPAFGQIPGGGAAQHLTRLMGRGRALEVLLSADDYDAALAERYGWVNRALPANELDDFVRSLADRLAGFPASGQATVKDRVNAIALAPVEDFRRDSDLFGEGVRTPEVQERIATAMKRGLQTRDFEMDLGRALGGETSHPADRFADYYPVWVDRLAADVTLEGSMLDGAVQGADAIRTIIGGVRELYDRQDFSFAGPCGERGFIEDYTAAVRGRPLGCLHLITFNADGETQRIAAHYRPLGSLMFFSRLLRERLAGTPYAEHFLAGEA